MMLLERLCLFERTIVDFPERPMSGQWVLSFFFFNLYLYRYIGHDLSP